MTASLYIHIPFCAQKCDYCDFYSAPLSKSGKEYIPAYIDTLCTDIEQQFSYYKITQVPSVYIGGGTPSVLPLEQLEKLLVFLKKIFPLGVREFTIEANPESLSEAFIEMCLNASVKRISIGVQSLSNEVRKNVGRIGSAEMVLEKLAILQKVRNENETFRWNADLISGLPAQTLSSLENDVRILISYEPDSISLYDLTLAPNTALAHSGFIMNAEYSGEMWLTGKRILEEAHYLWYEISNFAKAGGESVHNLRYWNMESWLGAGAGASGTVITDGAKRYTYTSDTLKYINNHTAEKNVEVLGADELLKDTLLMGYRTIYGPGKELFKKRFGCSIESVIPKTLQKWVNRNKMLFLNSFLEDAFLEIGGHFKQSNPTHLQTIASILISANFLM